MCLLFMKSKNYIHMFIFVCVCGFTVNCIIDIILGGCQMPFFSLINKYYNNTQKDKFSLRLWSVGLLSLTCYDEGGKEEFTINYSASEIYKLILLFGKSFWIMQCLNFSMRGGMEFLSVEYVVSFFMGFFLLFFPL